MYFQVSFFFHISFPHSFTLMSLASPCSFIEDNILQTISCMGCMDLTHRLVPAQRLLWPWLATG